MSDCFSSNWKVLCLLGFIFVSFAVYFAFLQSFFDGSCLECVMGGVLSGSLHVLAGPDHFASVLPLVLGRSSLYSLFIGLIWGSGHSLSSCLLGFGLFFLKRLPFLENLITDYSYLMDYLVGIGLFLVGIIGVVESYGILKTLQTGAEEDVEFHTGNKLSMNNNRFSSPFVFLSVVISVFSSGFVLGLSVDGLPSFAPAVAIGKLDMYNYYCLGYLLGNGAAMSLTTLLISIFSHCASTISHSKEFLAVKLAMNGSILACCLGLLWISQGAFRSIYSINDESTGVSIALMRNIVTNVSPIAIFGVICFSLVSDSGILSCLTMKTRGTDRYVV